MNLHTLFDDCRSVERRYWEYDKAIKHNPVRYPRVGETFLQEFFKMANYSLGIPAERKKKVRQDTIWYEQTFNTLLTFFIGTYIKQEMGQKWSVASALGTEFQFSHLWYLVCLYHEYGYRFERRLIAKETLEQFRKHKGESGMCSHDSRQYYKYAAPEITKVAPNFPIARICCYARPEGMQIHTREELCWREDHCSEGCKGGICFVNGNEITQGHCNYRMKEEFLYYTMQKEQYMDHGIAGADYMFQQLTEEYRIFHEKVLQYAKEQEKEELGKEFNCEPFKLFAYMADCLACHDMERETEEKLEEYRKYGLWQLAEEKIPFTVFEENPLLYILCAADRLNPIGKFPVEDDEVLMECFDIGFDKESRTVKWGIKRELTEMPECEIYIRRLKELENQIDIKVDIFVTERQKVPAGG